MSESDNIGSVKPFRIKWVLVDVEAERYWKNLSRDAQRKLRTVIQTAEGPQGFGDDNDRLETMGVHDGTTFHLYAIEDERYDSPAFWL